MKNLRAALLGSALALPLAVTANAQAVDQAVAARNSVLMIILDDIGNDSFAAIPVGPDRKATTPLAPPMPTIKALAQQGVVFGNAWAQMECSPTRAEIITGQYAFRPENGVAQWIDESRPSLPVSSFTLPEAFQAAGAPHMLAHLGKWHLSKLSEGKDMPWRIGWPFYKGPNAGGALNDYYRWYAYSVANGVVSPVQKQPGYATTVQVTDTIDAINRSKQQGQPYFITLALNTPHQPYQKPPNNLHSYDDLAPIPFGESAAKPRPYFEAMVQAADTEIKRLLKSVDMAHTTVIVIGDNGTPGKVTAKPYNPAHGKSTPFEQGVEVPIVVAGANVLGGRVLEQLVDVVDLYPTILALAGIDYHAVQPPGIKVDGVSLTGLLNGTSNAPVHTYVYNDKFIGTWNNQYTRGIRSLDWKLIDRPGNNDFLFNLKTDPLETKNLIGTTLKPAAAAAQTQLRNALAKLLATR